ncbi:MAG: glucose-6-phosphate isomerase [Pseudomonadota bacterium]|nr:glucose-6-phosphate isomerase [Pseudomonadota bacterium]
MTAPWRTRPRCDQTAVWAALRAHQQRAFSGAQAFELRTAFAQGAQRVAAFAFDAARIHADLSKNLIDTTAQRLLNQLAHECGLEAQREAMRAGERINVSEQRPVTHLLWRWLSDAPPALAKQAHNASENEAIDTAATLAAAARTRADMLALAERVRADAAITDVVNIGIGGSDLGPHMLVQALRATGQTSGPRVHFVSNMDGHQLAERLAQLDARRTLFIVVSKTFGTAETLRNAASAREWFCAQGGGDVARHFIAVSGNHAAARAFGAGQCLGFDDGVGGRFSLWSPVGLSIAVAAGSAAFTELLAGAHAMDLHFVHTPLAQNLPVQLALLDVWNRNFLGMGSRCIAPYHHGLRRLPAYLQQLEMESNGKRVDAHGQPLAVPSAPVTWGEVGSNGQHAFFQMLHQGSEVVPVEFVLAREAAHTLPGHHAKLLANALAQARALMLGQASADAPERHFPGNRPSTVLLLPDLSARSLGALLAMYEHRTFVQGALWGINSFDQWGVELGKRHAQPIEAALTGTAPADGLDASTAALLARLRA